jgi:hypothetical protein
LDFAVSRAWSFALFPFGGRLN